MYYFKKQQNKKFINEGFTMVELLMSIGIFMFLSLAIIGILLAFSKNNNN